jgi:hypothetical protein
MRLWNEMRREGLKVQEDIGERPELWEVALGEGKPEVVTEDLDEGKVFVAYHVSLRSEMSLPFYAHGIATLGRRYSNSPTDLVPETPETLSAQEIAISKD